MSPVLAAVVAAVGAIIVALIQRSRHENSVDHAQVVDLVRSLGDAVERVDDKLDRHVEWHIGNPRKQPK